MIKLTIRKKLLLLSVAVLGIPYAGLEYLRELESYLRDSLEAALVDAATAVAGPLHDQQDLFPEPVGSDSKPLFVHELTHPIELDGYTDDWMSYISWSDTYYSTAAADPVLAFRFIISRYRQFYYALLQVEDTKTVYREPGMPGTTDNDHVVLVFTSPGGELKRYYFSPLEPGEFRPFEKVPRFDEFGFKINDINYITNIMGVWRESENGYQLEMSIPVSATGDRMGIIVNNVDDPQQRNLVSSAGTAGEDTAARPGKILQSSREIEQIIRRYARVDGRRIWVLDNRAQVLASAGSLEKELPVSKVNILYNLILPPLNQRFSDDHSGVSRLQGEEISSALSGRPDSRWRTSPDGKAIIVSAAVPVLVDGKVGGLVVVEETTGSIQMQQRQAMVSLFNKTLLVFLVVTVLLLVFATRLSMRIRRLEQEAGAAIDGQGRVTGSFRAGSSGDEIGDLSRNYAAMLERLRQYNDYLENMAGRLSHELRTPIAVVQSSLEQLNESPGTADRGKYLQRAKQGIARLNTIVTRLSEATRLEQALQTAATEQTDVRTLLENCVEGYRGAYPQVSFTLVVPETAPVRPLAPDLFVQMLDKLIRNAIDFRQGPEPVRIELTVEPDSWAIHITNFGSSLPVSMQQRMFDSMVSLREKKDNGEPHLGLGLYVVKLIAGFHHATVSAANLHGGNGVIFTVRFPAE